MDRKDDGSKKLIEHEKLLSSTAIPRTKTTAATKTTATNDVDTSSESLESWTLINDRDKNKCDENGNGNRVEILKNSDTENENEKDVKKESDEDVEAEDDEDDEEGRNTSDDLFGKDYKIDESLRTKNSSMETSCDDLSDSISVISDSDVPHNESQIRRRRQYNGDQFFGIPFDSLYAPLIPQRCTMDEAGKLLVHYTIFLTKRGFRCALYVGLGLAVLALLGNFHNYSAINPLASINELQDKFNKIELDNNLLRAEIDLIYKKLNYLTQRNGEEKTEKYKEGKTFKAWSGNGDSLKPVDITKEDLKKPFKCPDGSFVEIANMCLEHQPTNEPPILDQFAQVVESLNEESASNIYETNNENKYKIKENSREFKKDKYDRRGSSEIHSNGYKKHKSRETLDSDDTQRRWPEKQKKPRRDENDSDEWRSDNMKHKERKRKRNGSKEDSGEWHENYMKNREQLREQTEQKTKQYKNVRYF